MIINEAIICDDDIALKCLDPSQHVSKDYVSWLNDPDINRHTETRFREQTYADVERFIEACNASEHSLLLGIFYQDQHIGNIKIDVVHAHKTASIGLIIGDKSLHGKGIGTKVIETACTYIYEEFDAYKINAGAYETNVPSVKAFEKAGFSVEYTKHKHVINAAGQREDVLMMVQYAD